MRARSFLARVLSLLPFLVVPFGCSSGGGGDGGGASGCPVGAVERGGACVAVLCDADLCLGGVLVACEAEGTRLGAPAACAGGLACADETACAQECAADDGCARGRVCRGGGCVALAEAGAACAADADCATGRCLVAADGVKGVCAGGGSGACLESHDGDALVFTAAGAILCDGTAWRVCVVDRWSEPVDCRPARCVDGVRFEADTCAAAEGCVAGAAARCPGDFGCADDATCRTTCAGADDCAPGGFVCDGGACVPAGGGAACVTGAAYCDGATPMVCDDASGAFVAGEPCGFGALCRDGTCLAVTCAPNDRRCVGESWQACTADGGGWGPLVACRDDEYCEDGGCVAQACAPGAAWCEENAVVWCDGRGTGPAATYDCGEATCAEGRCGDQLCTPGRTRCEGAAVMTCAVDGMSWSAPVACAAAEYCADGGCQDRVCEPGAATCADGDVALCDAVGAGPAAVYDCGDADCQDGRCVDRVCAPGATRCEGPATSPAVATCAADGMAWGAPADCGEDEYCRDGACLAQVCAPGVAFCEDDDVAFCAADGSGVAATYDCGDLHCLNGRCGEELCEAGSTSCAGEAVITCDPDGMGWGAPDPCGEGAFCADGACLPHVCPPGERACDDGAVAICDARGAAVVATYPCGDLVCVAGRCEPLVCAPGTTACAGDGVITCAGDGLGWSAPVACPAGDGCLDGACFTPVCAPGAAECLGATVLTCDALGAGYDATATCDGATFCRDGACHDQLCAPGAPGCDGTVRVVCDAEGAGLDPVEDCAPGACDGGACVPRVCDPGARRCVGPTVQVCADTGAAWVDGETCTDGLVCFAGDCAEISLVADEDFETGDLSRYPWTAEGAHPWIVAAGEGRDGGFAARTHPDHAADETRSLAVTLSVRDDAPIGFWLRLGSEDDHFTLTFLIDGTPVETWSGVVDWGWHQYPVGPGLHTFEWRYHRDDFVSPDHPMRNAVWLDDVNFPGYNTIPSVPDVVWPFDDAVIADPRPVVTWTSEDPDPGDGIVYAFQLDDAPTFPSPTAPGESADDTWQPAADLVDGATYWWRVRAKDDFDDTWGPWSPPRSFTVRTDVARTAWLQTTPAQLRTGRVAEAVDTASGVATAANVLVVTPYDNGAGCDFLTQRVGYDTSEDRVWCTHAPQAGYEYHHWDWTSDIAYGYNGGFRFRDVAVPRGVTIESAQLCLEECRNCSGYDDMMDAATSVRITADDTGDAAPWPDEGTTVIAGYSPTGASVDWSITGVHAACIPSPDIGPIVREVVSRPDWQPGGALRFLLTDRHGDGSYGSTQYWDRLFYSRDNELRVTLAGTATVTSPPVRLADLPAAARWDQAWWAGSGDVAVRVLDEAGDPIPDLDLPGNAAGFTARTIPLWNLDPTTYPAIRLDATLTRAGDDGVAALTEWSVTGGTALRWDFDNPGDAAGWVYGPATPGTTVSVADGVLRVDGDGADPSLKLLGVDLAAADFDTLEVTLRTGNTGGFDVVTASWADGSGGFGAHLRTSEEVFLLEFRTVTFDLTDPASGAGDWAGTVLNLRVDPVAAWEGGAGWFEVDAIVLR